MMIRAAQAADLSSIRAIEQSSATAAHWSDAAYLAILNGQDERRILLVSEADQGNEKRVSGFVVAARLDAEWELENIVVAEAFRGQGVGAALLEALVTRAISTGAVEIHAEVRASNPALGGFYKRHGFKEIGRRTKYYALPPEDAVLIRLLISRP